MQFERFDGAEIAKSESKGKHDPLVIAVTMDGAPITKHLGHVMGGVKMVHPNLKHPMNNKSVMTQAQSPDLCFPLILGFAKDTKELVEEDFKDFLDYFFKNPIEIPSTCGNYVHSNIKVVSPQDMKSH